MKTFSSRERSIATRRKIKLGLVTDEFFDAQLGRLGGFGWAARQLGRIFNEDPSLGVELVYVAGEHLAEMVLCLAEGDRAGAEAAQQQLRSILPPDSLRRMMVR